MHGRWDDDRWPKSPNPGRSSDIVPSAMLERIGWEVCVADEELTELEFGRFRALIYKVAGIQIPASKKVMVTNRLRRRLRATGIATFAAYYTQLTSPSGAAEMPAFLDAITTNETYFYRDIHHYEWF